MSELTWITPKYQKRLVGRRIVGMRSNAFRDGRGGWAYDPVLYLDDGSELTFSTQETDVGEYGTGIVQRKPHHGHALLSVEDYEQMLEQDTREDFHYVLFTDRDAGGGNHLVRVTTDLERQDMVDLLTACLTEDEQTH